MLPGCAKIQVLHYHEVRLEIFNESENEVYNWTYTKKSSGLQKTRSLYDKGKFMVEWRKTSSDEAIIQVMPPKPLKPSIEPINSFMWIFYGAILATVCILIGIAIAYFLLKSEVKKQFLISK